MAAAVAVAPVPFKDEDDDSSDDDFADELEAQLFEAEVKRDAVTARVKRERDEGRDEEPSAKRVVRDAGRREEQHDGREGLATLPLELTLQILRWLSPEDLTSVGTTCKAMAFATADDSLWRRCFCSRFGHPKLTGVRSWRALYFHEDARELRLTTSSAPPDLRHLYAQMQAAKRAQPPETHDDALLTLTDAENVSRWRATRGLSDGSDPASRHTCSIANGCSYRRFGADIFVCEGTGRAHMCDDSCRERVVDMDGMSEMCSISGRSFDRFLGEGADVMATGAMDGGAGEVGFTGERGWLGRAFEAGYGASSEREMYAALWGGDGSAGMRANRGVDSDDEVGSDSSDYDSES